MYTSHNRQIPGTTVEKPIRKIDPKCIGKDICFKCWGEAWRATLVRSSNDQPTWIGVSFMDNIDFQTKARVAVANYYNDHRSNPEEIPEVTLKETRLVWFSKVLQNWKALVITDVPDNRYYEVTYDGARACVYVDVYEKKDNVVLPD